jgi:FixJ family two-component response regulator
MAIRSEVRLVAFAPVEMHVRIRRLLASIGVAVDFISHPVELSHLARQNSYQVALLPASLADTGWWFLWGELSLLHPRPAVLVYAQTASFQLWSDVLEVGGHDLILDPFTDEELQGAVLRAAKSFSDRSSNEEGTESS